METFATTGRRNAAAMTPPTPASPTPETAKVTEAHRVEAREWLADEHGFDFLSDFKELTESLAQALADAERRGMERAAGTVSAAQTLVANATKRADFENSFCKTDDLRALRTAIRSTP